MGIESRGRKEIDRDEYEIDQEQLKVDRTGRLIDRKTIKTIEHSNLDRIGNCSD